MSTQSQSSPNLSTRSIALRRLFSAGTVLVERREAGDPADLLPAEAHHVAAARSKRVQEFAAGRWCARAALAEFGVRDVALRMAHDRQPVWPAGFVGSITHTSGLCAAVVSTRSRYLGLGIDSEIVGAVTADIWPTICRKEELQWVQSLPSEQRAAAVTLLFSAKEAFYKCQYPLTGEWLDFHDLQIEAPEWGAAEAAFCICATRLIRFSRYMGSRMQSRYAFHETFVSAGVAAPGDQ